METEEKQSKAGLVFDVLFELVLCFIVLIVAMLLSKGDVIGGPYVLDAALLAKMAVATCLVVALVVFISVKSTRDMNKSMEELKKEGFLGEGDARW